MPSLVTLVAYDVSRFDEVLAKWHDVGARSVTVLDCVGTRSSHEAMRADIPMLPRIRDLLQSDDAPRQMVISVVPDELVDPLIEAAESVMGDLKEPENGILFVTPVSRVVGLTTSER